MRNPTQVVVFVHIPKCGGSSIFDWISRKYGKTHIAGKLSNVINIEREVSQLRLRNPELDKVIISGHWTWRIHEFLPTRDYEVSYLTMLRHPLERYLSMFHWTNSMNLPIHSFRQYLEDDSHLDGLESFHGGKNLMVTYLGAGDLERAKDVLENQMAAFGLVEDMHPSLAIFAKQLDLDPWDYQATNVSRKSDYVLSPEEEAIVLERNQLDLEFYHWARVLFERRKREVDHSDNGKTSSAHSCVYLEGSSIEEDQFARELLSHGDQLGLVDHIRGELSKAILPNAKINRFALTLVTLYQRQDRHDLSMLWSIVWTAFQGDIALDRLRELIRLQLTQSVDPLGSAYLHLAYYFALEKTCEDHHLTSDHPMVRHAKGVLKRLYSLTLDIGVQDQWRDYYLFQRSGIRQTLILSEAKRNSIMRHVWRLLETNPKSKKPFNIGILGAGGHSSQLETAVKGIRGPHVTSLFDSNPENKTFFGINAQRIETSTPANLHLVLVSSLSYDAQFRSAFREIHGNGIPVFNVYEVTSIESWLECRHSSELQSPLHSEMT